MGIRFKYICDRVLQLSAVADVCEFCDNHSELFHVLIEDSDGNITDDACESCIRSLPFDWFYERPDEKLIPQMAAARFPERCDKSKKQSFRTETLNEFRRTPDLPNLINWGRWPVCCSDFAEYVGDAGLSYNQPLDGFDWFGPEDHCDLPLGLKALAAHPRLKSMDPISLFQCQSCARKFWTHYV
jgi:hypothetical protein